LRRTDSLSGILIPFFFVLHTISSHSQIILRFLPHYVKIIKTHSYKNKRLSNLFMKHIFIKIFLIFSLFLVPNTKVSQTVDAGVLSQGSCLQIAILGGSLADFEYQNQKFAEAAVRNIFLDEIRHPRTWKHNIESDFFTDGRYVTIIGRESYVNEAGNMLVFPITLRNKNNPSFLREYEFCLPLTYLPGENKNGFASDVLKLAYSNGIFRLMDKTMAVTPLLSDVENDYITRRINHVIQVMAVSSKIGSELGFNTHLITAQALGHDIGHSPLGHGGERCLNSLCQEIGIGYFVHNAQSVRVLLHWEGLDLTLETLQGIIAHNGEIVSREYPWTRGNYDYYGDRWEDLFKDYYRCFTVEGADRKIVPLTPEAAVVRISDVIAYLYSDMMDAMRLGHIKIEDIPYSVRSVLGFAGTCGTTSEEIKAKLENMQNVIINDLIHNSDASCLRFSAEVFNAISELKQFSYENLGLHPRILTSYKWVPLVMDRLFETYMGDIENKEEGSSVYTKFIDDRPIEYFNSLERMFHEYMKDVEDGLWKELKQQVKGPVPQGLLYADYLKKSKKYDLKASVRRSEREAHYAELFGSFMQDIEGRLREKLVSGEEKEGYVYLSVCSDNAVKYEVLKQQFKNKRMVIDHIAGMTEDYAIKEVKVRCYDRDKQEKRRYNLYREKLKRKMNNPDRLEVPTWVKLSKWKGVKVRARSTDAARIYPSLGPRDIADPKMLCETCMEDIRNGAQRYKKYVLVFDPKLGGTNCGVLKNFLKIFAELKKDPRHKRSLERFEIVLADETDDIPSVVSQYMNMDSKVFVFANVEGRGSIEEGIRDCIRSLGAEKELEEILSNKLQSVYIDEKGFKVNAYYPILEIITLAMEYSSDKDTIEMVRAKLNNINIERATVDGNVLIFKLLPEAQQYDNRELVYGYGYLKRFLRNA